ncbi:glycerophosphoryl diester phosphodiesterase family [Cryptosporidium sp. chipmunk genotype I]|uniref:glycerophosphoryl diester phosphodiesterase family n=1 Tax=Cryptosporidium sp. chipmunk genotype I TaxID=1280935 RepID=UPI00351A6ED8|nr:glycerophosphoryl diester phosphodiesterase family [Cryptosporidium sp. chipmunk genotype I]
MILELLAIIFIVNYLLLHFPKILRAINGSNSKLKASESVLGKGRGCLHISHRGGSEEALENTTMAFDHAINDCNTDMLETDVWLTKDNLLVVLHDENLLNICGVDKVVGEINYADLPLTKDSESSTPSSDFLNHSEWKCYPKKFSPQKLVTLEELFQRYPDTLISVDVKNPDNRLAVSKTVGLVRRFKRENKTMLGSFSNENINYLSECNNKNKNEPELVICIGKDKLLKILLAYFTGFLPWIKIEEHVLSFPMSYIFFSSYGRKFANKISKYLKLSKYQLKYIENEFVPNILVWLFSRKLLIKHLQKRGIRCFAWVCNNEKEMNICKELELDGIMSDRPTLLREYYIKNKIKPFK